MVDLTTHCHVPFLIGKNWCFRELLQMSVLRKLSAYMGICSQSRHSFQIFFPLPSAYTLKYAIPQLPYTLLALLFDSVPFLCNTSLSLGLSPRVLFSGWPLLACSYLCALRSWPIRISLICSLPNCCPSKNRMVNSPEGLQGLEPMKVVFIYNHYMIVLYI